MAADVVVDDETDLTDSRAIFLAAGSSCLAFEDAAARLGVAGTAAGVADEVDVADSLATFLAAGSSLLPLIGIIA